jgi:hypothetical protein
MPARLPDLDRDGLPVGATSEAQRRNAALLGEYQYVKYVSSLTGYTGQDLQRIGAVTWQDAVRTRIGPRGNYKAGMAQLPDGRLLAAVCRRHAHEDPAKVYFGIQVYRSSDTGLTWEALEHTPLYGKEPALAAAPDGALVLAAQRLDLGPDAKNDSIYVSRSVDGGHTWTTEQLAGTDYPRAIIVERDGTLTYVRALHEDWANSGKGSPNLEIRRSRDSGRTWSSEEGEVDWTYQAFGEVCAIRLRDGRLLAALRRQIPGTEGEGFEDTVLTESLDDGRHWCAPWRLTETAEVHVYLTELPHGRLLATHSNYHLPWGVSGVLSADGGHTWDHAHPILLALSGSYSVGWPVTLLLADGSLLTSYAATTYTAQEPENVTCEVVRWRLPDDRACGRAAMM